MLYESQVIDVSFSHQKDIEALIDGHSCSILIFSYPEGLHYAFLLEQKPEIFELFNSLFKILQIYGGR